MIVAELPAQTGWEAQLDLRYAKGDHGTILIKREHRGPLLVQKPFYPEGPDVCHSILVHPPGGIVAGDRLAINVTVESGAHALITTPGATKWYRSEGAQAEQHIAINVAAGANLEWLPQEAIVFNSAIAKQTISIKLADQANFLAWDILVLGRVAAQERFSQGTYNQAWTITRNGQPLWIERGQLRGDSKLLSSSVGLADYPVVATLLAVGDAPSGALVAACRAITSCESARVSISVLPQVLCARVLGRSAEQAKMWLQSIWHELRPYYFGRAGHTPRIWST